MKNRKVLFTGGVILFTVVSILLFLLLKNPKNIDSNNISSDEEIVSTIILDINPSIKLELDIEDKVINITALNDDAEDIIPSDFNGKELSSTFGEIADNLVKEKYVSDELIILMNVEGKLNFESVKKVLESELSEKNIQHDIIIPIITDSAKELAKKYNITESKAAYIESIINYNPDLKIEDIKDKSIKEINDTAKETTNKEEEKESGSTQNASNDRRIGSLTECERIKEGVSNERAAEIAIADRGGRYNRDGYCDVRSYESYADKSPEGVCAYKVTYTFKLQKCVYYINIENGNIVGTPNCVKTLATMGDNQCAIMRDLNISNREELALITETDTGNEFVSKVIDSYGTHNTYEYRVSKHTGQIISKTIIEEYKPDPVVDDFSDPDDSVTNESTE